jgi:hypothetical protein
MGYCGGEASRLNVGGFRYNLNTTKGKLMKITVNENYYSTMESFFCCDEQVIKMYCEPHGEFMGCYFCQFDYTEKCECEE